MSKTLDSLFSDLEKTTNIFLNPELIQTGIVPLDLVLNGGLETGSLIELSGESQTGKSTLLLHLAKNLCDKGYKTVYIDAEGSVKDDLINGVGLSQYVCTADNKDNKFLVIRESGYKAVETIIKKCLATGEFKLFIIDSLTALSPDIYLDESNDRVGTEDRVGYEAQLNGRLLKQLNSLKYKYNCIFIFINQTRMQMNSYGGGSFQSTGGQATKFYPDVKLFMKLVEKLVRKEQDNFAGAIDKPYGANTTIEARKSRLGPGFIPYPLQIQFGRGCSNLTAYQNLLPNLPTEDGEPRLDKLSSVTYELRLPSGVYKTSKGQNGLLEMIVEHYQEIEEVCQTYLKDYYENLKHGGNDTSGDMEAPDDSVIAQEVKPEEEEE